MWVRSGNFTAAPISDAIHERSDDVLSADMHIYELPSKCHLTTSNQQPVHTCTVSAGSSRPTL
eukprot:1830911-Amphidinium_carterae.1